MNKASCQQLTDDLLRIQEAKDNLEDALLKAQSTSEKMTNFKQFRAEINNIFKELVLEVKLVEIYFTEYLALSRFAEANDISRKDFFDNYFPMYCEIGSRHVTVLVCVLTRELNIAEIENLKILKHLEILDTKVNCPSDFLSKNEMLETLILSGCEFNNYLFLEPLESIKKLNLSRSNFKEYERLPDKVQHLDLNRLDVPTEGFETIANRLHDLRSINIIGCGLDSIEPLLRVPNLETVKLVESSLPASSQWVIGELVNKGVEISPF